MNNFVTRKGNYIKSKNSNSKIMSNIIIALIPLIIFSIYKNGILPIINNYGDFFDLIKPFVVILTPIVICLLCEYIYCYLKKEKEIILYKDYVIIPSIILGLIIPLNTPLWLIIIASIILSIFRILFSFKKNIFNPTLISVIFILLGCYYLNISYLNIYELNTNLISPLSNLLNYNYISSYENIVMPYGNLANFLIGNVPGMIGTTSSILCILALIYLIITKSIKSIIPIITISGIFISTLIIGIINGVGVWYPIFNILTGSLLFGLIFLASDNMTTPINKDGQIIYSLILTILIIIFRYSTSLIEYVVFISIILMNIITIFIDKLMINISFNKKLIDFIILSLIVILLIISIVIGIKLG